MGLDIQVYPDQACWVLKLDGELGYGESMSFRLSLDRLLRDSPRAAIVDLADLSFLDSSGLGLLLSLSRECTEHGTRLALITGRAVDSVLSLTRLTDAFFCASSLDEAYEHIGGPGR